MQTFASAVRGLGWIGISGGVHAWVFLILSLWVWREAVPEDGG